MLKIEGEKLPDIEAINKGQQVLFSTHLYQPPREIPLLNGNKLEILPKTNKKIHEQSYRPILVESEGVEIKDLPQALTFSFYGPIREWMKKSEPEDFEKIKRNIEKYKNKEYQVLGDPYLHIILPFLEDEDVDMLVKFGKHAFYQDLGFAPKGFWLPETAVSSSVLKILKKNGYEFVTLKDDQIKSKVKNPMYVGKSGEEIAVFHFSSFFSWCVSFIDETTVNGDTFLEKVKCQVDKHSDITVGNDFETYGHHKEFRDKFLNYTLNPTTLETHGLSAVDVKERLSGEKVVTEVVDNSSWSCPHALARWNGGCSCDGASEETKIKKQEYYNSLINQNKVINTILEKEDPHWRDEFIVAFLMLREKFFTGQNIEKDFSSITPNEKKRKLFLAKIYALVGMTSCGWFFGDKGSVERMIPKTMIDQVEKLLP